MLVGLCIVDKFIYNYQNFKSMNPDEEDWKKQLEKFKVVQRCPRCNELSLKFGQGKIKCSNCGFEQNVGEVK